MVKYSGKKRGARKTFKRKMKKSTYGKMLYKSPASKPFPFGQSFKTKLSSAWTQAVSATPAADYVISANSLYANGMNSTQPIGFDELCPTIYNNFRVSGVKITAKFINTSTTVPIVASVIPSNSNTSITSLNSARAMAGSVSRVVLPSTQQNKPSYHKLYRDSAYVLGVNKQTYKDEDYAGSGVASPTNLWYIHLNTNAVDEASATSGYWLVNVVYYCTFFNRKNLLLS